MTSLNIIDGAFAEVWKRDVERLNDETKDLLKNVGEALQEVKGDADSTIVDEIYKYGNQILGGVNDILSGMNQLVSTVTNLLSMLNNVLDTGKNIVKSAISGLADALF